MNFPNRVIIGSNPIETPLVVSIKRFQNRRQLIINVKSERLG